MHVDAENLAESRLLFEQCGRKRPQFAADPDNQEPLFSHESQITEREYLRPRYCFATSRLAKLVGTKNQRARRRFKRTIREPLDQCDRLGRFVHDSEPP